MPRGKGRRLAGRVEGEAGRCGERAVCEELDGIATYEVESKFDDADDDDRRRCRDADNCMTIYADDNPMMLI